MIYKTFALAFIFAFAFGDQNEEHFGALSKVHEPVYNRLMRSADTQHYEDQKQGEPVKAVQDLVNERTSFVLYFGELRKSLKNGKFENVFENIKKMQPKFSHPCMTTCDRSPHDVETLDSAPSDDVAITSPNDAEMIKSFNNTRFEFLVEKLFYEQFDDVFHLLTQAQPYFSLECMKTCPDYNPMPEMENWMSTIDPETHIYDLKIPGTHDTVTFALDGSTSIGLRVKESRGVTQLLSVKQQLNRGVRWFDARVDDFQNGCKVGMGHYLMRADYCFENMLEELNAFLKTHPSEIVFLNIAYSKERTGAMFRKVKPKVSSLLKQYEQNLCLNTFTKLKDFHDAKKRLCISSGGYSVNFLDKKYVFPDNNQFKKTYAPKIFANKAQKPEKRMTRTQLNTFSLNPSPIHSRDLRTYSDTKAKDWFASNLKELNIVSMDFYGEKLSFVKQMMEENKQYRK